MATIIKCDKCGNSIEVSDAISKELEAKILKETEEKHRLEVDALIKRQKELESEKEIEIAKVKAEISENAKKDAIEKVRKEYDSKIVATKEEAATREQQNIELQKQLSEMMKQLRESRDAEGRMRIQFEKQLLEEQDKIKQVAKREVQEELTLQMAQKDKMLEDLKKQLQDAQRKAEQGSQQLQGEVQEVVLEELLKSAFIYDDISEVPKGIKGADIIQIVRTNSGIGAGTIVWESKNTKSWSDAWITKLKEDTRTLKADISVLVTSVLPDGVESFAQVDGIWVSDMKSAIPLAFALRERVLAIRNVIEASKGKSTKAEIVYDYLISNDFKQRIEVWIEYFKGRKDEIDVEKRYFMKKWEKEEKNIMKVMQSTAGMYGDLQGLIGVALPKVQDLELPDSLS